MTQVGTTVVSSMTLLDLTLFNWHTLFSETNSNLNPSTRILLTYLFLLISQGLNTKEGVAALMKADEVLKIPFGFTLWLNK